LHRDRISAVLRIIAGCSAAEKRYLTWRSMAKSMNSFMYTSQRILRRIPYLERSVRYIYDFTQGIPLISYSEITSQNIRKYVGIDNPVILEIGSNDGSHTSWFLEAFAEPKIYCFEPDPRAASRFKKRIGNHPNVQLFEIAICNHNGTSTFYQSGGQRNTQNSNEMPEGWDLSGSIRKPKEHLVVEPEVTFEQTITVETSKLDSWCSQHGIEHIDFIWMDTQGSEMDVFRGGKDSLAKTRFLYTEYSNREMYEGQASLKKMLTYLQSFGVVNRYPSDILLKNKKVF
jgi:2-O-methyltransferase